MAELDENDEYTHYLKSFKNVHFEDKLKKLSRKYKGQKILLYGNGIYFDAISDSYDLNQFFDIIGVSDKRYGTENIPFYKGFKTYKPEEIKSTGVDVVIITTICPKGIISFFRSFDILDKKTKLDLITTEIPKTHEIFNKICNSFKYLFLTANMQKTLKYFRTCNSVEINSKCNYLQVLKRIRNYPPERKIRVTFICEENSKWGYQSVYDELKKDNKFEILPVICLPIITKNREQYTQKENIDFFNSLGIEAIDGYNAQTGSYINLRDLNPDIVFYQQHWYSNTIMPPEEVSQYALTGVVSYGFTSVNDKIWGMDTPINFCGNLWQMFAESKYHKSFYETASKLKNKDILTVTGYPKLDYYKTPVNPVFEEIWKDKNITKKHRIIWAPHHSIEKYGFGMSNFKQQAVPFLEYAMSHPDYHFLVKPHPALKYKCQLDNFMTPEEYDNYMAQWNNLPNAVVYDRGNYFDIFKTSDVLVTDSSSFLGEYYVSGKPILFFESTTRVPFNEFGINLKKGFYTPKSLEDMDKILTELLINKNDYLKTLRMEIMKKEIYLPPEGIGKKICNTIREQINC